MPYGLKEIFPDFALTRSGAVIHLAVIGFPDRLERFAAWLTDIAPTAFHQSTMFDYEVFGARKEDVFDLYDHILRIEFPTEAVAFADCCGPDLFARKPAHKRNLAPLRSKPKAVAQTSGIALPLLRSVPIRGCGQDKPFLHEVGVAAALVCNEIDQRGATIRLGLSGRVALRRRLVRIGWLATWPVRAKVETYCRYL